MKVSLERVSNKCLPYSVKLSLRVAPSGTFAVISNLARFEAIRAEI